MTVERRKTFFFSSSGGHTEKSENVFGGAPIPYLRGVRDEYDDLAPRHRWSIAMTGEELEQELGSLVQGRFDRLEVVEGGASRRIVEAVVHGSLGSRPVSGRTLKSRLGTYDIPWAIRAVVAPDDS